MNGSYWLITFTDVINCWICNKKAPEICPRLCLYSTQCCKVNHFSEKHLKECRMFLLTCNMMKVSLSEKSELTEANGLNELSVCPVSDCQRAAAVLHYCLSPEFLLSFHLCPPMRRRRDSLFPFWQNGRIPLLTDRQTSQSQSEGGASTVWAGFSEVTYNDE